MFDEIIKPTSTSANSLDPLLNCIGFVTRINVDGQCLKQDKATFNHKTVVNIYIVYEINLWPFKTDFTLGKSLLGTVKLTKMLVLTNISIRDMVVDFMHIKAFCYLMVAGFVKNVIIFVVHRSSFEHADNSKKDKRKR